MKVKVKVIAGVTFKTVGCILGYCILIAAGCLAILAFHHLSTPCP